VIRAVTFDFWNTLMWEEPGSLKEKRLEVWAETLPQQGVEVDPLKLEAAHDAAHRRYEEAWRAGRQFVVEDATAQIAAELWGESARAARDALVEGYSEAGRRAAVHPSEGVAECLGALADAGVRIGLISDIGLTPSTVVRELLDRAGLLGFFDGMSFSDEVGCYKPAPGIFEHALESVGGGRPGETAHVGDRCRTDVGGALACGWTAVRYLGTYDDPAGEPEGHIAIARLAELPDRLGVPAPRA
jgi:putative hydrolase of the HAD superfamily